MNIPDLIADLRSRINPAYADVLGTESYERRVCVEALEAQQAEIEQLRVELRECDDLREKMSGLLRRTSVALRGPEPPMTRWTWHDLPERAAAAIAAIDVMQRAAFVAANSGQIDPLREEKSDA